MVRKIMSLNPGLGVQKITSLNPGLGQLAAGKLTLSIYQ